MRLQNIKAVPHPLGHRIDLSWENPDPGTYPGICVVRKEGTHPTTPNDGFVIAQEEGLTAVVDKNLRGETTYYYMLFPYYKEGVTKKYAIERANQVIATATARYNMAGQMFDLLPSIYARYDNPQAREGYEGPLRRFLAVVGSQLDQLYSGARTMEHLHDVDRVDGRLLPLLAQWIGWQTDRRKEINEQRNEIRFAPYLYSATGTVPAVETAVKRVMGWKCHSKEFINNILTANNPERLNLWAIEEGEDGTWTGADEPFSLDFAYRGHAAAVTDNYGVTWLFYHTQRKGNWDIWYKTYTPESGWLPSSPFTTRTKLDKFPTTAILGDRHMVYWSSCDEDGKWAIHYRVKWYGSDWSVIRRFGGQSQERRHPHAVTDSEGGMWLFWFEKVDGLWQLQYNRHNGQDWEQETAHLFPPDPWPINDIFLYNHPTDTAQPLWFFWARRVLIGDGHQSRWEIAYRVKGSLDSGADDWSEVRTLAKIVPDCDDREPTVLVAEDGRLRLFWSSNRDRSYCLWQTWLDTTTHTWDEAQYITRPPYTQRAPLPLTINDRVTLIYRSSRSIAYQSDAYQATTTYDTRYSGGLTVDSRNVAKIDLYKGYKDFQTYTYDIGANGQRTDENWYAWDTVGIYLIPDRDTTSLSSHERKLILTILQQFFPIQVRTVFILEQPPSGEVLYTYDFPEEETQVFIGEETVDSLLVPSAETMPVTQDGVVVDRIDWIWMRSWSETSASDKTVDTNEAPIGVQYRTWRLDVEAIGKRPEEGGE